MRHTVSGYLFLAVIVAILAGIQQGSNAGSITATNIYHLLVFDIKNPTGQVSSFIGIITMWNGGTLWQGSWFWAYLFLVVISAVGFGMEIITNVLSGVAGFLGIK